MIKKYLFIPLFAFAMLVSKGASLVSQKDKDQISAEKLKPLGRFDRKEGRLELISSAVHFGVTFEGERCVVLASLENWQDHNYIQYELDGVYQKRLRVKGSKTDSLVISAGSGGKHTLWIFKATEAHSGPVFIHSLQAKNIKPLKIAKRPLIEFIGNSITCGAAADGSDVPCGEGEYHDHHNAYQAYGPRVARKFGLNYILSSVSGYGIYRNWNSDGPPLPQVYDKLDLQENSTRTWNSAAHSPDIISIALGTNDFSDGDGKKPRSVFDSVAYINAYVNFVKKLKKAHPDAQIVLLGSPMVRDAEELLFRASLNSVKRQIDTAFPGQKPLAVFFFKEMSINGCSWHPSVQDHEIMAQQLRPFLENLVSQIK